MLTVVFKGRLAKEAPAIRLTVSVSTWNF